MIKDFELIDMAESSKDPEKAEHVIIDSMISNNIFDNLDYKPQNEIKNLKDLLLIIKSN